MRRFFWKLLLGHALIVAAALIVCLWLIVGRVQALYETDLRQRMGLVAAALTHNVSGRMNAASAAELVALVRDVSDADPGAVRITLIARDGTVLADSQADAATMESHGDRPEVTEALREGRGEARRRSQTVGRDLRYIASRVGDAAAPQGVVRLAYAADHPGRSEQTARTFIWTAGGAAAAAIAIVWIGLVALWTRPLERIAATARRVARGDLDAPIDVPAGGELSLLARSLERMRDRLASQIRTIDRQRRTLESLLRQLHEGVVVADAKGRVVLINPAAAELLQAAPADASGSEASIIGAPVERCVPQHDLQQMLLPVAGAATPRDANSSVTTDGAADSRGSGSGWISTHAYSESRLEIDGPAGTLYVLAHASNIALPTDAPATDAAPTDGDALGRLLVLTNITELERTLQIKTDFVANASHELRTPISTIRAAVETLLSIDAAANPEDAARFIGIIDRQSARLADLVGDLLELARVESAAARFEPKALRPRDILEELRTRFAEPARGRGLNLVLDDSGLRGRAILADPHLLRLVLNNLVDNALKFTPAGGEVRVAGGIAGDYSTLVVSDTGCGIAEEDRERVFERFYQVERSRSGRERGTGLGLSIARHAVGAMGGKIELASEVGKWTRVTISLPMRTALPRV